MNLKYIFTISGMATMMLTCQNAPQKSAMEDQMNYPETRKDSTVADDYFGTRVSDPYRWLENDTSAETELWVKAQNNLTFDYLNKIPYRDKLKERLTELWNYEKYSAPFERGGYTYFSRNDGLQNQNVFYRQKTPESEPEVFLDPNQFSEDGTTSLAGLSFTKDGSMAAYQISEGGLDWTKLIVIDAETMEQIGDTLVNLKFSRIAWRGNNGFYYSSYDQPRAGSQRSGVTDQHKLLYHELRTPQDNDRLIFGGAQTPRRYIGGYVTEDENYLVITAANSTSGNELYIQSLRNPAAELIALAKGFDNEHYVLHSQGNRIFIKTNYQAPNGRIVTTDISKPLPENWEDLIPETENVLSAGTAGGKIFATYMIDATDRVFQYSLKGEQEREIKLPGVGSAGGFSGRMEDREIYYTFTSYVYPASIFKYDLQSGTSELFKQSGVEFQPEKYVSKQVFYQSKDGTRIPMIITHKKDLEMNGKNPTMLYGYGGFNVSLTPFFSTSNIILLENGGVFAVANLRGGGEYGEAWHEAGMKMNKQNVFDDFIAAAEYLIDQSYTSSAHLAIAGGSNGGLLVGAVMTQRPDLVAVALPAVGVLDMLRYHKFTAGAGWSADYGTADESREMFDYLKGYSPYHNLKDETSYPATMVTTGDHDDRVVPAHSFKFAARLQEAHRGENPVLIRIETDAGHGAGKPTSKIIEEQVDKWAFMFWNMGYKSLPGEPTEES